MNNLRRKNFFITIAFAFIFPFCAIKAQQKDDSLYSNVLHEERFIQVFLPDGYKPESKYDVLYALDGEMLARFIPPIISFEQEDELMPAVIVIGIKNNYWYNINMDSRERDLLPAHVDGSPLSGGADKFISFIKDELMPYVNRNYATSGKNILFGHSYGGMFTMYSFLTHPEIFDSYIASDPALWWNEGFVDKLAETKLTNFPATYKTLFMGGRSGSIYKAFGIRTMDSLLKTKAPHNLRWQSMQYADEHHGSVRLKNIYDGLKFTYFGYSSFMLDFFPQAGILLKDKPVPILLYSTYLGYDPGIRYTSDGSEPTTISSRYEYGTLVSAPVVFTMKQFSNYGQDKIMKGNFRLGNLFQSVQQPVETDSGGFHYAYYESDSVHLPDYKKVKPLEEGITNNDFSINTFHHTTPFACKIDGYFKAEKDGYYTFFLEADYIANLYIDDSLLININVPNNNINNRSFVLPLEKGFYTLKMEYLHKHGDKDFSLTYLPVVKTEDEYLAHLPISIPGKLQYSKLRKDGK